MNPADKAAFDADHAALITLRTESELEARFDAFVVEVGPLVLQGIGLGAEAAASLVPGGPVAVLAVKLGSTALEGAFSRWLAKKTPKA